MATSNITPADLTAQMNAAMQEEMQMQALQTQNDQQQQQLQAQSSIEQAKHDTAMSICKAIAQ